MIVLLDLEWIELGDKHLTQLAAVRTDEQWNVVSRLEEFVHLGGACLTYRSHVAFGGHSPELFANAMPADDCISDLEDWLEPDDVILVWALSNKTYLMELWSQYAKGSMPPLVSAAIKARSLNRKYHFGTRTLYGMLSKLGIQPPFPEHRAAHDVEVMRLLFRKLNLTLDYFNIKPSAPRAAISQRDRNLKVVENSPYNYIYLKNSEVFHRRDCKAVLNAGSHTVIFGSFYYETAAEGHRPCKLCKPIPFLVDVPIMDKELSEREKQQNELSAYLKGTVDVKMLTGQVLSIRRGRIVGWCRNRIHPGALNKAILEQHDCLGKNCSFLEKNCQSPFWRALEEAKLAKEKLKAKVHQEKQKKIQEESELHTLADDWGSYLEEMQSDMQIVRVVRDTPICYRIFYVSDNRFADGNRYPEFLERLRQDHPRKRIILRHIRDVDGHFVTREEFRQRRRK